MRNSPKTRQMFTVRKLPISQTYPDRRSVNPSFFKALLNFFSFFFFLKDIKTSKYYTTTEDSAFFISADTDSYLQRSATNPPRNDSQNKLFFTVSVTSGM